MIDLDHPRVHKNFKRRTGHWETPNHVPCRHNCGDTISWADYCWVHDSTGFADCHLTVIGGLRTTEDGLHNLFQDEPAPYIRSGTIILDPVLTVNPLYEPMTALPIGEWR